jgi:hypothetical protein
VQEQREGCEDHLMIPGLVPYAEPVDSSSTWVAYRHRESGKTYVNGPADMPHDITYGPVFSSTTELHKCPGTLLPDVPDVKDAFPGGKVASCSLTELIGTGTAFDDMESDARGAIPTKPDSPAKRASRKKISDSIKQLEAMR